MMKKCLPKTFEFTLLVVFSTVFLGCLAAAQDWKFVRDDYSTAIQPTDTIVATLVTSRAKTEGTFLTNVDEVGIVLQATVVGSTKDTAGNVTPQQVTFPLGYKAPVLDRANGFTNLPFDNLVIPSLTLKTEKAQYDSLTISVALVKVEAASAWGAITTKLLGFATNANIPASPYSAAAKYVLDFANSSVSDALSNLGNDEKVPLGQKVLNFRTMPQPKSGSYVLIEPPVGNVDDANVDPTDMANKCLYLRMFGGGTTIMVGHVVDGAADTDGDGCSKATYTPLKNPYVRILLQTQIAGTPGIRLLGVQAVRSRREKLTKQCDLVGIAKDKCFAAK